MVDRFIMLILAMAVWNVEKTVKLTPKKRRKLTP